MVRVNTYRMKRAKRNDISDQNKCTDFHDVLQNFDCNISFKKKLSDEFMIVVDPVTIICL